MQARLCPLFPRFSKSEFSFPPMKSSPFKSDSIPLSRRSASSSSSLRASARFPVYSFLREPTVQMTSSHIFFLLKNPTLPLFFDLVGFLHYRHRLRSSPTLLWVRSTGGSMLPLKFPTRQGSHRGLLFLPQMFAFYLEGVIKGRPKSSPLMFY